MSQPPLPPLNYVSRGPERPSNPMAVVSLVCGVLLCVPWVASILAAILGKVALRRAKELGGVGRGPAKAGLILGLAGIGLWAVLSAASVPAVFKARRQARQMECMSNLRQISLAGVMYMHENKGYVPPDLAALQPNLSTMQVFTCPAAAAHNAPPAHRDRSGTYSYVYLKPQPPVRRITQIRNASEVVMIYEPPENHGGAGFATAYWDGHVEWHKLPEDANLLKQLEAQRSAAAGR